MFLIVKMVMSVWKKSKEKRYLSCEVIDSIDVSKLVNCEVLVYLQCVWQSEMCKQVVNSCGWLVACVTDWRTGWWQCCDTRCTYSQVNMTGLSADISHDKSIGPVLNYKDTWQLAHVCWWRIKNSLCYYVLHKCVSVYHKS